MKHFLLLLTTLVSAVVAAPVFNFTFSSFVRGPNVSPSPNGDIRLNMVPTSRGTAVIQSFLPLPTQYAREVYCKYDVLFEPGFEWVLGGKLPGVFGGSKSIPAAGCVPQPLNAWSVRLMWRPNGVVQLYLYDQSRRRLNTPCGTTLATKRPALVIGFWTTLQIHVKLNSGAGKADGLVELYINGTKTLQMNQVELRGVDTGATIDWFLFSVFYGGHEPNWAPSKTTHIKFRRASCGASG